MSSNEEDYEEYWFIDDEEEDDQEEQERQDLEWLEAKRAVEADLGLSIIEARDGDRVIHARTDKGDLVVLGFVCYTGITVYVDHRNVTPFVERVKAEAAELGASAFVILRLWPPVLYREGWEAMPRGVTYFQMLGRPLQKLDADRLVSECSTYEEQKKIIRRAELRSREGSIDEEAAVMRAIRDGNGDMFGL